MNVALAQTKGVLPSRSRTLSMARHNIFFGLRFCIEFLELSQRHRSETVPAQVRKSLAVNSPPTISRK